MIKLKDVSKFYYSKGVIASGFSKVNLEFNIGEFVVITGESGSGKSTLLNVISGLDSYEEGEMYINGEETSHYTEKDFEIYRRKYIGNIFQSFNLINSYTVYQNIELVLLLNGSKKKDVKQKVIELIKKVDLYKFRNTKVSKLSGGQKQRVAIARALAKETPIIIADEPTGNLDSKSAETVMKVLSDISKEKLVIIVTHNYEQVENYATRKIIMHDGKVLEDKELKEIKSCPEGKDLEFRDITFLNKLKLGIRNTFNIIPKFALLFIVYLFITSSLLSEYASNKKQEYLASIEGQNYFFNNTSDSRIIIKKQDKTAFTQSDFDKIKEIPNVEYIVENDKLLENNIILQSSADEGGFGIFANMQDIALLDKNLDLGRLPENEYEFVIEGSKDDYYIGEQGEEMLGKEFNICGIETGNIKNSYKLKLVGIKYRESNMFYYEDSKAYASKKVVENISSDLYSTIKVLFMDEYYESNSESSYFKVIANDKVPEGKAYVSRELNNYCEDNSCLNKSIEVETKNIYYTDSKKLTIEKTYGKNDFENLLDLKDYDNLNGAVFINTNDYNNLLNRAPYQSSVFVKDAKNIEQTVNDLKDLGLETLAMKDTLLNEEIGQILKIFRAVVMIILIIVLFFISYFVINIILKSRNTYFSTIRMLGASEKVSKNLLTIELLTVANISYFSFIALILLVKNNILNLKFANDLIEYLKISDYVILYVVLILMSYLISRKFARKLFKKSTIKAYNEEV